MNDLNFAIMFESDKAIVPRPAPMKIRGELAAVLQPLGIHYSSEDSYQQTLRDFSVNVTVDDEVPVNISVDKSLLRVIYNLITNAARYCVPHGEVKISLSYKTREHSSKFMIALEEGGDESEKTVVSGAPPAAAAAAADNGDLTLTITNSTARPLDLVHKNRLFQTYLYAQDNKTNSSKFAASEDGLLSPRDMTLRTNSCEVSSSSLLAESLQSSKGLGLGLYVSYNIVQCLNGLLECATTDNTATFTFTLPIEPVAADQSLPEDSNKRSSATTRTKCGWSSVENSSAGSKHVSGLRARLSSAKELDMSAPINTANVSAEELSPRSHRNRSGASPLSSSSIRSYTPKYCILVVDDSPICRKVLVRALETHGYATDTACDGQVRKASTFVVRAHAHR